MPVPALSICVLHYNRWDLTKHCLASIDTQDIPCHYEKLLCDNGSETFPGLPQSEWMYRRSPTQRGNIGGQNFCFEQARGEWVLFVANDVRLQPYCLWNLWKKKEAFYPKEFPGQVQPMLTTPWGSVDQMGMRWQWPGYGLSLKPSWRSLITYNVPIVVSTCYLMNHACWKAIGGFDESLQSSHEDIDMGLRLRQKGYWRGMVKEAKATHLINATLQHTISNPRQMFHQARLKVLRKHYRGLNYWTRYTAVQMLDHLPHPHWLPTSSA